MCSGKPPLGSTDVLHAKRIFWPEAGARGRVLQNYEELSSGDHEYPSQFSCSNVERLKHINVKKK